MAACLLVPLFILGAISPAVSGMAEEQQQEHQVRGQVIDEDDGSSLVGVNIRVKGTLRGTTTNPDGNFSLRAPSPQDTLLLTYIGYNPLEVPIGGRSEIRILMTPSIILGEGAVVTGYQVQRREEITGSVSVIRTEDITDRTSANVLQELQGRVPGMMVRFDGSPFDHADVVIRGFSTLGNNAPLYVIDGIPSKTGAIRQLNPSDIESIQVLRDASAASIYGSRASNGVIVIQTKSGVQDRFEVEYSARRTTSRNLTRPDMLNTQQRGEMLFRAGTNDGQHPRNLPIYGYDFDWERVDGNLVFHLHEVIIPEYIGDPSLGIRSADTDWYDEVTRTGLIQQHDLSVSAGTDRSRARFSLRYHSNDAIVQNQDFERITARINSEFNFFDRRLTVGENLSLSYESGTPLPSGLGGTPMWLSLIVQPILPVYTETGAFAGPVGGGFDDRDNPVRLLYHNRWDQSETYQTYGNVYARFNILDNLVFNTRFGIDWQRGMQRNILRRYQTGFLSRSVNSLSNSNQDLLELTNNATLEYTHRISGHEINVIGGIEAMRNTFSERSTRREDFPVETLEFMVENAGVGEQFVGGSGTGFSLLSYFSRANYNYQDRYMASATFRYDGSSRFGVDNRFGFFPAISAGWRLSEENFFPEQDYFTTFMVRAGYGIVGNQEIGNESRFSLFHPNYSTDITWAPGDGTAYDLFGRGSGNLPAGIMRTQTGNPILRWEQTAEINIGTDLGFFSNRLRIEMDLFHRDTEDILVSPPYLGTLGDGGNIWYNGASVEVRGFDAMIRYSDRIGDLRYNLRGTLSAFRDKVVELPPEVRQAYPGNVEQDILGRSPSSHFGFVVDGIFQNQEEVDAHADQPGAGVGRLRFRDINGDGVIDELDQTWLGTNNPDFEFGFGADLNYRNFDLSFFFQGLYGADVFNSMKIYTDFTSMWSNANWGKRTLQAWTPENPDSDIPRLTLTDTNQEARPSTYFIEDGSFLKLRELRLGYRLPDRIIGAIGARELRIFIQGENLVTISHSDYTGPDPENPGNAFPYSRNFTTGLNLKF